MSTSPAEAMQDIIDFHDGREIELGCSQCGERWLVHVPDGEDVSSRDAGCHCGGDGEEL